jgi:hypothetical protein
MASMVTVFMVVELALVLLSGRQSGRAERAVALAKELDTTCLTTRVRVEVVINGCCTCSGAP